MMTGQQTTAPLAGPARSGRLGVGVAGLLLGLALGLPSGGALGAWMSGDEPRGDATATVSVAADAGLYEVREVVDGDTLRIDYLPPKPVRTGLRLLEIDTPELRYAEPLAEEAREAIRELVAGQRIRIEFREPGQWQVDSFGRLLVYVFVGKLNVNVEMVRRGFSRHATSFRGAERYRDAFRQAEREAVEAGRGLWGLPNPPPAWPLDVNRASAAELEYVPGIGPALAKRIVEEREANGPFEDVADVTRVRGIGMRVIEDAEWGYYLRAAKH